MKRIVNLIGGIISTQIGKIGLGTLFGMILISLSLEANPMVPHEAFIELITFDSWLPAVLGMLLATTGWTIVHAQNETKRTIKGIHWKRTIIRGILLSIFPLMITRDFGSQEFWSLYLINIGYFAAWFDPLYNKYKSIRTGISFPWYYLGSEALIDTFGRKLMIVKAMILIDIAVFAVGAVWFHMIAGLW